MRQHEGGDTVERRAEDGDEPVNCETVSNREAVTKAVGR